MPLLPTKARFVATLAALFGCWLAVAPNRQAEAAGCHVSDRPVFGLSTGDDRPILPEISDPLEGEPEPIRVERRCPSDDPERPPSRSLLPGDLPLSQSDEQPDGDPVARFGVEEDGLHPIANPSRIDRPPQRS